MNYSEEVSRQSHDLRKLGPKCAFRERCEKLRERKGNVEIHIVCSIYNTLSRMGSFYAENANPKAIKA